MKGGRISMRDKSTMNAAEFIAACVFYGLVGMIWYRILLFRCLGTLTYAQSRLTLLLMLAVSALTGCFLLFRRRRNSRTVTVTLLLTFGLYTAAAYIEVLGKAVWVIMGVCVLLAAGCTVLVMTRPVRDGEERREILCRRLERCLFAAASLMAAGMAAIMAPLILRSVFGIDVFTPTAAALNADRGQGQTIEDNMDIVLLLQPDEWEGLEVREKLNVMQTIANIEARYLGLSNELNVGADELEGITLAQYNDATYTISIDLEHLENSPAGEVLDSCCHEAYHSYQHRLVEDYSAADTKDLFQYQDAAVYAQEFGQYIDGDDDPMAYYTQKCETDAREYAETAVLRYYTRISEYLGTDISDYLSAWDDGEDRGYTVTYEEDGQVYLHDSSGSVIAGPYPMIYEEGMICGGDGPCRYMGENGLTGYLSEDGSELTPPIYAEASSFRDRRARVREENGGVYYINTSGERISEDYADGSEYEHQGNYARVQCEDGTWGIIDSQGQLVFQGADSIEPLPEVTTLGSAVVDGRAVLFELNAFWDEPVSVIREYDEFCDISEVYSGAYAFVATEDGRWGVVDCQGDVIVPAEYVSIEDEDISDSDADSYMDQIVFICRKADGTCDVVGME